MSESMQSILGTIVGLIGTVVVAGGGLAAIAYWLFRVFSEKWLSAKFEERLAAYKHAQQKELEHLRLEINSLWAEWDEIRDALRSYSEWKKFYLKNGIFMTESIKRSFGALDDLIRGALVEHKMRVENMGFRHSEMKDFNKLLQEGKRFVGYSRQRFTGGFGVRLRCQLRSP